jgi:hypothetical protein
MNHQTMIKIENKMELAIQKYIKEHGLENTIKRFDLKTREYDNKILLKYNQLVSPSMMANQEVQDCRGIILEKGTWNVMSLAFRKFFNSEEGNAHKIDWKTARVLEKLDGTMIQVYWDEFKQTWFAGTTGTAEGEGEVNNKMGTTFNDLFWNTVTEKYGLDKDKLNKNKCYVFELTTPYNIVVKPHAVSSATLLTVRDLTTLAEEPFANAHASNLGIPYVKAYDLNATNVGHLKNTFENMPWSDEGYVVVDYNFNRVKIKNPAYVAVHHLKGKSAEHNIITIVKSNEIEEFGSTFPERKEELYKLKVNYDILLDKLNVVWEELKLLKPKNIMPSEKKRYAMEVFNVTKKYDLSPFTGLYFGLAENKITSVEDFLMGYDDKALYRML